MKITMVGTGYVGLVSGACFAELGHDVICVDKDERKIDCLRNGVMPIYEPGLEELVARNVAAGRLSFSLDLAASVKGRNAVFIAVGTPPEPHSGRADLQYVFAAAREIAANLDRFTVVVTKSTVPVGTNRRIAELAVGVLSPGAVMTVASNPEFLREGQAISDFLQPDRIVVGSDDVRTLGVLREIYQPLVDDGAPLIGCSLESAEIVKYAANAFLAIKVAMINEVSDLCEAVGADVGTVAAGVGADHRIGRAFLRVGPGWGGSCFPKDTRALVTTAQDHAVRLRVLEATIEANSDRKASMASRVAKACGGALRGKCIAVLGLTFKGQTDDLRESPSLQLVVDLCALGARVRAYDPSQPHAIPGWPDTAGLVASAEAAVESAEALVLATDWDEFVGYDLGALADLMADPVLVDLRNMFDPKTATACGFRRYLSLGRSDPDDQPGRALRPATLLGEFSPPIAAAGARS